MANIRAFRGVRPCKELASEISALPYDVYSRAEAKHIVLQNPYSFLKIDRPETQFPDDYDMYCAKVYEKAQDMLKEMIGEGQLIQDDLSCYYVYELETEGRIQAGIVGCAAIDDYLNDTIMRHENTRHDKETDRICHIDYCQAQTGPIFLAYRSNQTINQVVEKIKSDQPLYDFIAEDGVRHSVWQVVAKTDIKHIQTAFEGISNIYIADGHHRAAAAVKVGLKCREKYGADNSNAGYNYFLSVLFPDEQLSIMGYNRIVHDLNGHTYEQLIDKIKKSFTVLSHNENAYSPTTKGNFGMCVGGNWYELKAKNNIQLMNSVEGLDVSLLQNYILDPILGIKDPKTDSRISFAGAVRGSSYLEAQVKARNGIAFTLFPTSMDELFQVSDAGFLMPPKSTWFEPKLRSGLFIHKI